MAYDMDEFPRARSGSVIFMYKGQMFVWGGMTQVVLGEGDGRFIIDVDLPDLDTEGPVLEILDLNAYEWSRQITIGDVPKLGTSSFHALINDKLYLYGGFIDGNFKDSLHQLDLNSYTWKVLPKQRQQWPPAASGGGSVVFGTSFVIFGGACSGNTNKESQCGGIFKSNQSFGYTFPNGWNNYLHEYDTLSGTWTELECFSERPQPLSRFTFTKIDPNRALLFGGKQDKYRVTFSHVYIFDFETKKWTFYNQPQNQEWPCPRGLHVTTCLVNPDSIDAINNQYLLTVWGQDVNAKHVNDAWILHVQSMKWKKFLMPEKLKPRMFHMACSYHIQNCQTDVVIFGGNKQRRSKYDRNVIASPIIIRYGSVQPLLNQCINLIRKVGNVELCANLLPPSLQRKLSLSQIENETDITVLYPLQSSCGLNMLCNEIL